MSLTIYLSLRLISRFTYSRLFYKVQTVTEITWFLRWAKKGRLHATVWCGSNLGSVLLNTGFCLCLCKGTYVLQAKAPESQPLSSVCVTHWPSWTSNYLTGVNHKKVFGLFLVLHREMSTSQREVDIFEKKREPEVFIFERWQLAVSSFDMISIRLSGVNCLQCMADPWEGSGRPAPPPPPPLFLDQTRSPWPNCGAKGQKKKNWRPGTPPYLKVWIRHWFVPFRTVSVILSGARDQPSHPEAFLERMGFGLI